MYINVNRLVYPTSNEIEVTKEDVVDKTDLQEHCYNVKVMGRIVLSLTEKELETLVDKGGFALRKE